MLSRFKKNIAKHKARYITLTLILLGISYLGYGKLTAPKPETRYVLATVAKDTIIVSVSGTGQVSASNQVELKSQASGTVTFVGATDGQQVKTSTLIAQLDASDAQKTVRDAEANLASAKLSLSKLQQPIDALALTQAQNALAQAQETKQKAINDLTKTYDDGFNTVSNAFLDIPQIMTGLKSLLFDSSFDPLVDNLSWYVNRSSTDSGERAKATQFRDEVVTAYNTTRTAYTNNFNNYKTLSRISDRQTIEAIINETYATAKLLADTIKLTSNFIDFTRDSLTQRGLTIPTLVNTQQSSLNSYTGTTNSHLINLLSIQNIIRTSKETITSSDRTITEKIESLAKLKAGTDPLDIQSQQITIKQRENTLMDAREKLADYFIRAPFEGVVANIAIKKGESISSSTAIATIITAQRIAEIALNEIDVAKVKIGQKTTLLFDAIPDLDMTGHVTAIDAIGTVSQGVVTYNVKIVFDTQDDRVKPGMSVSAAIIIDSKIDVLAVPNSAIKTQGATQYVEKLDQINPEPQGNIAQGITSTLPPSRQTVEIGIANDTSTEIISGVRAGDQIITRTIAPTSATASTSQAPSLLGGGNRGGGSILRTPGR